MRHGRITDGPKLRGPIACAALAVIALSLGPSGEAVVRSAVRDASRPGYLVRQYSASLVAGFDLHRWPWTAERSRPDDTRDRSDELAQARLEVRRLRADLAQARQEIAAWDRSLGPVRRDATGTADVERIPARILQAGGDDTAAGGVLLGAGTSRGMDTGQLAVEPITLTAGSEAVAADGGMVLAGAAVVGRTADVGLWTATLLPVTHREFRAHVALVRESDAGPVAGEEGILEGDGRGRCLVRYVPSTASVAVGDHVYSFDPTGRLPQPLYYGRVEQAELRNGAPHWEITVRPAAETSSFGEVHVLRSTIAESPHPVTMAE